jgi:ribosomal protein S27AE
MTIGKITPKRYKCKRCGHETVQSTNHYGNTWSCGHFNTCPKCPPWAKYAEFGGSTVWICQEPEPVAVNS